MRKLLSVVAVATVSIVLVGCNMLQPTANTGANATGTAGTNGSADQSNNGATSGGGTPKSQYWPTNIPTISAGYEFGYSKISNSYYLQYKVTTDKDVKSVVTDVNNLLKGAGWTLPEDSTIESDTAVVEGLTNSTDSMTLSVSKEEGTTNVYSIIIITAPKE